MLELSEEYFKNDKFTVYKATIFSTIDDYTLGIYEVGDKIKHTFATEQEAIDWVEVLFSLRGLIVK